jgi:hypothetical protein
VRHDHADVAPLRSAEQHLQGCELAAGGRISFRVAALACAAAQELVHLFAIAAAQVVDLLGDDEIVGRSGDHTRAVENLVGPVARGPQREADAVAAGDRPRNLHQAGQPGLVVGEVDESEDAATLVEIEPPRVRGGVLDERRQTGGDLSR